MTLDKFYTFEIPDTVYSKFEIPDNVRDVWWYRCGDRYYNVTRFISRPVLVIDVPINWKSDVGHIVRRVLAYRRDSLRKEAVRAKAIKIIYRLPPTYDRTKLLDTCLRAGDGEGYEMQTQDIEDEESKWFCVDFTPTN
uniref:Uncharacterized protein n=1 Tax=viral metagenome TaxID=1070528 RepID=A0A6C0K8S9_9ZZZZ